MNYFETKNEEIMEYWRVAHTQPAVCVMQEKSVAHIFEIPQ